MVYTIVFWVLAGSGLLIGLLLASPANANGILCFLLSNLLVLSAFAVALVHRSRMSLRSRRHDDNPPPPRKP